MSHAKFSKYAADGTLYTDANRPEFTRNYICKGYATYKPGINSAKRAARAVGYKSLKQFQRDLVRKG